MKKCPSCNFINTDDRSRCLRCKTALDPVEDFKSLPTRGATRAASLGFGIALRRSWRAIKARFEDPLPDYDLSHRLPFLAGLLGLFPGLGQLYNRQPRKASLFFSGFVLLIPLNISFFTSPLSNLFIYVLVSLMLSSYADAFAGAMRLNGQEINRRWFLALICWLFFMVGVSWSLTQVFFSAFAVLLLIVCFGLVAVVITAVRSRGEPWPLRWTIGLGLSIVLLLVAAWIFPRFFFTGPLKAVGITRDLSAPTLQKGDRLWVSGIPYWFHDPRIGDIVYYYAQWLEMEQPGFQSTYYGVRIDRHFERVVALGGDTYERRDGVFYRNGNPVPPEEQPLVTEQLWKNFKYTVPEDCFLILLGKIPDRDPLTGASVPAINSGVIIKNYEEVVFVPEERIIGRLVARYNPPARRQWF